MAKFNLKTATLEEMEQECESLQGSQFGHNMIGLICSEAEKRFGEEEADRLFNSYQYHYGM